MEIQNAHNEYVESFLSQKQKDSFAFFKEKFEELYNNPLYRHKFLLISGNSLLGIFDNYKNAIRYAVGKYKTCDYIVQELIRDDERVNFLYPALGV